MSDRYYRNKRILSGYNHLLKQIDDLTCDYAELYTQATKINQVFNDDVRPANHDAKSKVEGITIKLAETKAALEKAIARRKRIDKAVKRLPVKYQMLVKAVDINRQPISKAVGELGFKNYKYACRKHREIIEDMYI